MQNINIIALKSPEALRCIDALKYSLLTLTVKTSFEQSNVLYNVYIPIAGIQFDEPIIEHISEEWLITALNEYLETKAINPDIDQSIIEFVDKQVAQAEELQCCLLSLFYLFDNVSYELTFGEVNVYAPNVDISAYIGNISIVKRGNIVTVHANDVTLTMVVNDQGSVDVSIIDQLKRYASDMNIPNKETFAVLLERIGPCAKSVNFACLKLHE